MIVCDQCGMPFISGQVMHSRVPFSHDVDGVPLTVCAVDDAAQKRLRKAKNNSICTRWHHDCDEPAMKI